MNSLKVEETPEGFVPFQVRGPDGAPVVEINDFLQYLATCGRSAYTQRSYAMGLAHFFGWLRTSGKQADLVTRHLVGQYIAAFSHGPRHRPGILDRPGSNPAVKENRTRGSGESRRPRTINHRLSVLASFFAFCIRRDQERGRGAWFQRANPIYSPLGTEGRHGLTGRNGPPRGRAAEFRRRVPRDIPSSLDPVLAEKLIGAACSYRDKAILTLLLRTAQRIGDWNSLAGRHGVLGMGLADVDDKRKTITVRLKGDRDEHRVPVTDDFWPLFHHYLTEERGTTPATPAAWVGLRRGKGRPLTYSAFESSLRYISRKTRVNVHAHLFRHTVAQAVLETTGNLKVAQELLGHAQLSTTADLYMRVDERSLVAAVTAVKTRSDQARNQALPHAQDQPVTRARYAFAYDEMTIEELDKAAALPRPSTGENRDAKSEPAADSRIHSGQRALQQE